MSAAAVPAIRIVSLTLIAASLFMLETSYYLYIDHIGFSILSIVLKDGVFSIILPILFSWLFGENGVWIGIAAAPVAGLVVSMAILLLRVGRERFPWLLDIHEVQIYVYDDILSPEVLTTAAREIQVQMEKHQYPPETSMRAALFVEEISSTIMERNKHKRILIEYTLLFEKSFVRLVIRDSGVIFDITDPDLHITGLSSYVINYLLNEKIEKGYVTTTGYNRNQIRFDYTFVQD